MDSWQITMRKTVSRESVKASPMELHQFLWKKLSKACTLCSPQHCGISRFLSACCRLSVSIYDTSWCRVQPGLSVFHAARLQALLSRSSLFCPPENRSFREAGGGIVTQPAGSRPEALQTRPASGLIPQSVPWL